MTPLEIYELFVVCEISTEIDIRHSTGYLGECRAGMQNIKRDIEKTANVEFGCCTRRTLSTTLKKRWMPSWNVKHNIQHDIKNVHVELEWWSSRTFSATLKNADVGLECWARRTFSATCRQNTNVELECRAGTTFSTTCRQNTNVELECRAGTTFSATL